MQVGRESGVQERRSKGRELPFPLFTRVRGRRSEERPVNLLSKPFPRKENKISSSFYYCLAFRLFVAIVVPFLETAPIFSLHPLTLATGSHAVSAPPVTHPRSDCQREITAGTVCLLRSEKKRWHRVTA